MASSNLIPDPTYDDNEDYFVPLIDQRVFGAGLKRKRVAFVPAADSTSDSSSILQTVAANPSSDVGNRYLSIVLGESKISQISAPSSQPALNLTNGIGTQNDVDSETTPQSQDRKVTLCPICKTPIDTAKDFDSKAIDLTSLHEASLIHQLHQPHSHPPSHLNRQRKGLKYLQTYGWDPDSRVGLGASGKEGIRIPIKAKEKRDTAGLGLDSRDEEEDERVTKTTSRKRTDKDKNDVVKRLDAKQVRKVEGENRKKAEKLRKSFYGDDLEKYLGPGC